MRSCSPHLDLRRKEQWIERERSWVTKREIEERKGSKEKMMLTCILKIILLNFLIWIKIYHFYFVQISWPTIKDLQVCKRKTFFGMYKNLVTPMTSKSNNSIIQINDSQITRQSNIHGRKPWDSMFASSCINRKIRWFPLKLQIQVP